MLRLDLVHLPEWTFDRKRISVNSKPNLIPNSNPSPNPNFKFNPNPKEQKYFRENKTTSFFGPQVSRYPC